MSLEKTFSWCKIRTISSKEPMLYFNGLWLVNLFLRGSQKWDVFHIIKVITAFSLLLQGSGNLILINTNNRLQLSRLLRVSMLASKCCMRYEGVCPLPFFHLLLVTNEPSAQKHSQERCYSSFCSFISRGRRLIWVARRINTDSGCVWRTALALEIL